jgi:hypothetical protein
MSKHRVEPYLWIPGTSPDAAALDRMRKAFPKPRQPMGEAWFMSKERLMFPELMADLDTLSDEQLYKPLEELAGGPCCFGQHEEWTVWFHYLLPLLVVRDWERYFYDRLEIVITSFMSQHPDAEGFMPYRDFQDDALNTLGRYLMSPKFWPNGAADATKCLGKHHFANGTMGWHDCSGLLSGSLFFCLKYLPASGVSAWFQSVFAITDPRWQAQLAVWLVGAHPILSGEIGQPGQFPELGLCRVHWDLSHVLKGNYSGGFAEPIVLTPFLPEKNRKAALHFARSLNMTGFFENLLTDPTLEDVAAETASLPERFGALYGPGAQSSWPH